MVSPFLSSRGLCACIPGVPSCKDISPIGSGPTLVTSFNHNYFLKGPSPNPATLGMMGSTYEFWGTSFNLTLEEQLSRCGKQQVQRACGRTGCLPRLQARVAGTQWRRGAAVVGTDLPELRTLVQGRGGSLIGGWGPVEGRGARDTVCLPCGNKRLGRVRNRRLMKL